MDTSREEAALATMTFWPGFYTRTEFFTLLSLSLIQVQTLCSFSFFFFSCNTHTHIFCQFYFSFHVIIIFQNGTSKYKTLYFCFCLLPPSLSPNNPIDANTLISFCCSLPFVIIPYL